MEAGKQAELGFRPQETGRLSRRRSIVLQNIFSRRWNVAICTVGRQSWQSVILVQQYRGTHTWTGDTLLAAHRPRELDWSKHPLSDVVERESKRTDGLALLVANTCTSSPNEIVRRFSTVGIK